MKINYDKYLNWSRQRLFNNKINILNEMVQWNHSREFFSQIDSLISV